MDPKGQILDEEKLSEEFCSRYEKLMQKVLDNEASDNKDFVSSINLSQCTNEEGSCLDIMSELQKRQERKSSAY